MKKFIVNTFYLTIPSIILCFLVLEIIFRYIIPATDFPYYYYDSVDQMLRFDTNKKRDGVCTIGKFAFQRSRWHVNNFGWNSAVDYQKSNHSAPLIAIIGDSYIEGFQVNVEDNIAAILRRLIKNKYEVYSFGISGAPLSQYLQMSRYVVKHFNPSILVINVVHNDLDESLVSVTQVKGMLSFDIKNKEIIETAIIPYNVSYIKRGMRYSSTIRYLNGNLKLQDTVAMLFGKINDQIINANIDVVKVKERKQEIEMVVDYTIKKLKEENCQKKIIIMIDALRQDIYRGTLQSSNISWINKLIHSKCEQYNIYFLDLTNDFSDLYHKYQRKFESDIDGHWNNYGHESAAKSLMAYLQKYIMK